MNALRFDGKVVAITGAAQGVGRGYALAFARRGAKVVVNDLAEEALDALVHQVGDEGGDAIPHGPVLPVRKAANR